MIQDEKLALEAQERLVDERATEVRQEIQEIRNAGGKKAKQKEADLMQEWFQLVNKKNSFVRQQDLLALMEEEQAVGNEVEKIHAELIPLMTIEESMKTFNEKERELELLNEKVRLINERDRLIQLINEKEKIALDEEERLQTNLGENMNKMLQQDDKCIVM